MSSTTVRLVVLAMAVGLTACVAAQTTNISASGKGPIPPLPPGVTAPRWEHYCTVFQYGKGYLETIGAHLAEAGQKSWEMVLTAESPEGLLVCFKRPAA